MTTNEEGKTMPEEKENYFTELNAINVTDKTEKKGQLTYLSWAWAWGELKKVHPDATYTVYENDLGWNYHTDNSTCWVKVGVTVNGIEHIEYLPVMDYKNKAIPLETVDSMDVNKAIQRALTKAIARHGLGLYIYAGEDLPDAEKAQAQELDKAKQKLTDFCYQYDPTGNTAAAVWQKYDIDGMTDPADVLKILNEYKAKAKKAAEKAAKKAEQMPEEVNE